MRTPLVHWAPKGPARDALLRLALGTRLSAGYFTDYSRADRFLIFRRFSEEETFYRPLREVASAFRAYGLECSFTEPTKDKLYSRLPTLPRALGTLVATLYLNLFSVYMTTSRTA